MNGRARKPLWIVVLWMLSVLLGTLPGRGAPGYQLVETDIDYVGDEHIGHRLDIYHPTEGTGPFPVVIFIYGSAWASSNKKDQGEDIAKILCPVGFAVVSINHRGTMTEGEDPVPSGFVFPDQIHDAKAAVRFIRAHATSYGLNPNRIGVLGGSSGGHLAALLGTSGGIDAWTAWNLTLPLEGNLGAHTDVSSSVQAVFVAAGTADLLGLSGCPEAPSVIDHDAVDSNASRFIGGALQDHPEACTLASPLTYIGIGPIEPPFAIVHGREDDRIPWCQSRLLHETLQIHCVPSTFALVDGYGHDDLREWTGFTGAIISFFTEALQLEPKPEPVRFATFNASLHRSIAGALLADLSTDDPQAQAIAEIVQRIRPDVLVIDEFDYDYDNPGVGADLFRTEYLGMSQAPDVEAIEYPHMYLAPNNNGIPSGHDLDRSGGAGGPEDALGYGHFEGQYGSVLYSKYPIRSDEVRTFTGFLWKSMPGAALPTIPNSMDPWYTDAALEDLPLASNHFWDVPIEIGDRVVHVLTSHARPPTFDGDEKRKARRNHDQIRFWADYIAPGAGTYIYDDSGVRCGLPEGSHFVIMGDQNADPEDGSSFEDAILQLLGSSLINTCRVPASRGGVAWAAKQGGINASHSGDPRYDTGDFPDGGPGNLRADYVLPSKTLDILDSGVFWPSPGDPLDALAQWSDHRLVWVDVALPDAPHEPEAKLALTVSTASAAARAGQKVVWEVLVANVGDTALHGVHVLDPFTGADVFLDEPDSTLCSGKSRSISLSAYTLSQEDVDRGSITIETTASAVRETGVPIEVDGSDTFTIVHEPALRLEKTADRTAAFFLDSITYTFDVTNTGNVTLHDIEVIDAGLGVTLSFVGAEGLPPDASVDETITCSVSWSDYTTGISVNSATASATGPLDEDVTTSATCTVRIRKLPWTFEGLDPDLVKWLFEAASNLMRLPEFLMLADVPWGSEVFDSRYWDDALDNATSGPDFVINLFGHMMVGTGVDGSILTVGNTPITGMTEWFKLDPWLDEVPFCARGDDIEIRFALADMLTGGPVRDDTANLTVVRIEPGAIPKIVRWMMIPYCPGSGSYEAHLETSRFEAGRYDFHIGTSFDAVNRSIRIEIVGEG